MTETTFSKYLHDPSVKITRMGHFFKKASRTVISLGPFSLLVTVLVILCTFGVSRSAYAASELACSRSNMRLGYLDHFFPAYHHPSEDVEHLTNSRLQLVVRKRYRELLVLKDGKPWKTYRIALSRNPKGDKIMKGDRRTPEGNFYVTKKINRSKYFLSFEISYPSIKHAKRALELGLISEEDFDSIASSLQNGKRPPQNTPLGGHICIHGGGNGKDWTDGCVALKNRDILELFRVVRVGTPVVIMP